MITEAQQNHIRGWLHSVFNSTKDFTENDIKTDIDWLYGLIGRRTPDNIFISNSYYEHLRLLKRDNITKHDNVNLAMVQATYNALDEVVKFLGTDKDFGVYADVFDNETRRIIQPIIEMSRVRADFEGGTHSIGYRHDLWMGCYSYLLQAGILEPSAVPTFMEYYNFLDKGIFDAGFYEDAVYLCKLPTRTLRDASGMPSSVDEAAIQWRGHKGDCYFINGVSFDKVLWENVVQKKITAKNILKIENIEQKYIALKIYGAERMLGELDAKLIDTGKPRTVTNYCAAHYTDDEGHACDQRCKFEPKTYVNAPNELYGIDDIVPQTLKLLKYKCPSTGRIYVSLVPYEITKADSGMAWKLQLTDEEYSQMKVES